MTAPIDRVKKILALARRGVGGEKTTAEAMLARLMSKYGLTIVDLDDQAVERKKHWFKCSTEMERRLLSQIVCSVLGRRDVAIWRQKGKRDRAVELSPLEFAEVDVRFEACKPALRAELKKVESRVFVAFVHANHLSADTGDDEDAAAPVDLDELAAIIGLMQGMKPVQVHRQIEHRAPTQGAAGL